MTRKPAKLRRRYNADGSITLYSRGRKVYKFTGIDAHKSAEHFARGWYGDYPVVWGRPMFAKASAAKS